MAAYCLAMAEVWVRFPLGALDLRVWESLAFRVLREHEIVGSNPTILTDLMRWVPCWYGRATVNRFVAGSIPASAAFAERKGKPIGDGSRFESGRAISLESSTLSPSAYITCSWPSGKGSRLPTWRGEFDSRRALFRLIGSVAQRQSRCLLSTSARVRVPPVPLKPDAG